MPLALLPAPKASRQPQLKEHCACSSNTCLNLYSVSSLMAHEMLDARPLPCRLFACRLSTENSSKAPEALCAVHQCAVAYCKECCKTSAGIAKNSVLVGKGRERCRKEDVERISLVGEQLQSWHVRFSKSWRQSRHVLTTPALMAAGGWETHGRGQTLCEQTASSSACAPRVRPAKTCVPQTNRQQASKRERPDTESEPGFKGC